MNLQAISGLSPEQILLERILLEKELTEKTKIWWDKFNSEFRKNYEYPTLSFEIKGEVAGIASYQKQEIRYSLELYKNNKEDFFSNTIPHVIAHLFNYKLYKSPASLYFHAKPHGQEWRNVMRIMGLKPDRCHDNKIVKDNSILPETKEEVNKKLKELQEKLALFQ